MVRWNGSLSSKFDVTKGVKQGGVLLFFGAIIYGDDITLLGPTRNSVIALLDICSKYAHDHNIIFNPSKTTCIYFP